MELRVLRYFLMTAREENITRAAKLLHITQPTLSRQLMQLEEELGVKLFYRGKYNVSLTEAGMLLKRRAQEIVSLSDKTIEELSNKNEILSGEIAIGCGETRSMSILSKRIAQFRKEQKFVQFDIYSAIADDIKERIENGTLDLGLLSEPVDIGRYEFIRMPVKERWGILTKKNSELAHREFVVPKDLIGIPLLMAKRELVKRELAAWFGDYFEQINIAASYNLGINAATMVRNGVGTALFIDLGAIYEDLCFVPFSPTLETGSVLVWKKNQMASECSAAFIEYIKNTV